MVASISETRDALATKQDEAIALSQQTFAAIETILSAANFWLTLLSVGLTILGLIGVGVVYLGARSMASKVAEGRIKSYLEGDEIKKAIQKTIADEIQKTTLVMINPHTASADDEGKFRRNPKEGASTK